MKRVYLIWICLIVSLTAVLCCCAESIDPILLDEPSDIVFTCDDKIFIEVPSKAFIDHTTSGRVTSDYFFVFTAEVLFLDETIWNGMDKNSFTLKHVDEEGNEVLYPLNLMMTMMLTMKNNWRTLSDELIFADLRMADLVFTVKTNEKKGWSLLFSPAERGSIGNCEVEVPLWVR